MAKQDSDFASGKMIRCSPDPDAAEYQKDRINFVDAMKQDAFSGDELKLDGNIILGITNFRISSQNLRQ